MRYEYFRRNMEIYNFVRALFGGYGNKSIYFFPKIRTLFLHRAKYEEMLQDLRYRVHLLRSLLYYLL